ncbi:MAG: preprotein translocase subunit SecY [Patescibacteria group bacterium]
MFRRLLILFTDKELRNKILLVIGLALACRLVLYIPLPFVKISDFVQLASNRGGDEISNFLNTVLGAGYGSVSVGMLGIGPYITASIVIQLLTVIVPSLTKLQEEGGTAAQMKMNQYTRLLALFLSFLNGFVILLNVVSGGFTNGKNPFADVPALATSPFEYNPTSIAYLLFLSSCLAGGTLFLMWLSEIISETKIANGASLLVLISSLSSIPVYFSDEYNNAKTAFEGVRNRITSTNFGNDTLNNVKNLFTDLVWGAGPGNVFAGMRQVLTMLFVIIVSLFAVIFVNEAIKKITILYSRRGHTEGASRMTGSVTSSLPVRITGAGLMGIIIAVAFITMPVVLNNLTAFTNVEPLKNSTESLRCFMSQDSFTLDGQRTQRFNSTPALQAKCFGVPEDQMENTRNPEYNGANVKEYELSQIEYIRQAPKNKYLNFFFSGNQDELNSAKKINTTDGQELFNFSLSTFKEGSFKNEFDTGLTLFGTRIKTPEFKLNPGFLPEFGVRFNGILAYYLFFFFLIIFFNYFFTLVVQNSSERIAKDLQKTGAYIPGVNPGKLTEQFLESKTARIILPGSIFTALIAIAPYLMPALLGFNSQVFSVVQGTLLFIIVSTSLEIIRNLDAETSIVDYERYSQF